jgi:rhodanese-related sulfurtransferase
MLSLSQYSEEKMKSHSPLFLAVALSAKSRIKEITVHEVKAQIESPQPPIVIDVREDNERAAGYIPNAIHLSKGVIERDIEKMIPDLDTAIVLYCSGGFRSAIATAALKTMGYQNVCSMLGGCSEWVKAGYPFVRTD